MSSIIMYKNKNVEELNSKIPYINSDLTLYIKASFEEPVILNSTIRGDSFIISNLSEKTVSYIVKELIKGMKKKEDYYIHYRNDGIISTYDVRDKNIMKFLTKEFFMTREDCLFISDEENGEKFFELLDDRYYYDEDAYYEYSLFDNYYKGFYNDVLTDYLEKIKINVPIKIPSNFYGLDLFCITKSACKDIIKYNKVHLYNGNSRFVIYDDENTTRLVHHRTGCSYQNKSFMQMSLNDKGYAQILGNVLWNIHENNQVIILNDTIYEYNIIKFTEDNYLKFVEILESFAHEKNVNEVNIYTIESDYSSLSTFKTGEVKTNKSLVASVTNLLIADFNYHKHATVNIEYLPTIDDIIRVKDKDFSVLFSDYCKPISAF